MVDLVAISTEEAECNDKICVELETLCLKSNISVSGCYARNVRGGLPRFKADTWNLRGVGNETPSKFR